ncbi:(2Fe-2S)-binding protein [Nitratireductor luteus]|uniref:(2Fe-2S)-binding protein n=1 Tax=Nitratireductor luteus TaxID=2976980 RepID=UPI0022409A1E|nr:(2Fe-2S)-binding protein [Nitratireductor luteus]
MDFVSISVNGTELAGPAEPRNLLVEFLRANGLTGTHVGCDTSQCGACNVLVDGKLIKSCTAFAVELQGRSVTTIEGVAVGGALHPIQRAFHDYHGLQCGFCTPGMIIAALALLQENTKPTEDEIRAFLAGSICRCTGYQNIVTAIQAAAEQMESGNV